MKRQKMKKESILIRSFNKDDTSELLKLIDLNTPKYFAAAEKIDFCNYLKSEVELYYVITFENKIVGCGGINFENKTTTGIISWDIIHPDFQGKSLGKKLVEYRLDILHAMKEIEKIIVRTSQITFPFYQKQGFRLKEKIDNYWAEGFDLYYMEYQSK
jgi:ribosomal-protein-alanine N-acetyltransferase